MTLMVIIICLIIYKAYYNILKNACEGFRLNYKKINPIGIINGWIDCIRMKTSRSG